MIIFRTIAAAYRRAICTEAVDQLFAADPRTPALRTESSVEPENSVPGELVEVLGPRSTHVYVEMNFPGKSAGEEDEQL